MLSAYEKRNKNFFRNFEFFPKLPAFFVENAAILPVLCPFDPFDYAQGKIAPDRETSEPMSRVNSE